MELSALSSNNKNGREGGEGEKVKKRRFMLPRGGVLERPLACGILRSRINQSALRAR